ncbi:hypothetical protein [Microbacterium halotolerans]|uniref:hypothetical protein n=1 Tax=Microbacterium halotolerans TaxID=246613 RepID=UPI000E6AB8A7|nr:hypothetical protein [Microbacterium halotolerans]
MAERSYPFVDGETTDAEFSAMFRHLFPSSVVGYPGQPGLEVVANSSGLRVELQPGEAFVRGHRFAMDAPVELVIDAATSVRVDTVILRMEYGAVQSITPAVKKGVAGVASPPTLDQTEDDLFEFPLADIALADGQVTIGPSHLTDRRAWWGIELMKSFGIHIGAQHPDPAAAFLSFLT